MASSSLQSIIVSKRIAKTRNAAEKIARKYANRIYTSRETGSSWRFRQRPPTDFVKNSFRTFQYPGEDGIAFIYGKLKRQGNPYKRQSLLQFPSGNDIGSEQREWDYWMSVDGRLANVRSARALIDFAHGVEERGIKSVSIKNIIMSRIADKARSLRLTRISKSYDADLHIYNELIRPKKNPKKKTSKKATKKTAKKAAGKTAKYENLVDPRTMPDPGPCSWLGSLIEWGWEANGKEKPKELDDNGNAIWKPGCEWMFLWSPKFKAVVAIKRPKSMYKAAKVSTYGNAAKMFKAFMARPAKNAFEIDVPNVKLQKVGKRASHIVYRSDKWSKDRKTSDYIHDFRKLCDVDGCRSKVINLYCGPSLNNPEVFLCFGGKLTLTERGLVW